MKRHVQDIHIHFTSCLWDIAMVAVFSDDTTCPHFCIMYDSLSNQNRMDVCPDAYRHSALFHSVLPPADLGVWQPCCPAGKRKLQIQSHDRSVGKPKHLKDRQAELGRHHLDETWSCQSSVLVFVFHNGCKCDSLLIFKPKTNSRHSWRADLNASGSLS